MKKSGTILKFELDTYFKSKSFIISTIIICIFAIAIMFIPRIIDSFDKEETATEETKDESEDKKNKKLVVYDAQGVMAEELVAEYFTKYDIQFVSSADEVNEAVEANDETIGFVISDMYNFEYYVYNKDMRDSNSNKFSEVMVMNVKMNYCVDNGLDIEEFAKIEATNIDYSETILGKDSNSNYWYCYIMVIMIFMIIIMYGTQIASSVTNEKSNRSIEILVTTTNPTAILFGKVFAGAIAAVFQVGLVAVSLLSSYQFNKDYWGGIAAKMLDIPSEVLITFAVFGIGGFLIYAFMYGALGALVSKIEDLNKSAGTAQMVVMLVYFITLFAITEPDGIVLKICSFLPISSYSAMFARIGMGSVAMWEIVVSALILYGSVVLMGLIGGKIFRSSTLRYGNPIKISNALKGLKKNKQN